MQNKKNPWVSAVLNFIWPGLGYLYNGKRIAFGVMLVVSFFALGIYALLPANSVPLDYSEIGSTSTVEYEISYLSDILSYFLFLLPIAFGYDAFKEAKELAGNK